MFFHLFLLIIPAVVYSQCYSPLSPTWICNGYYQSNNITYETVFTNKTFVNIILNNYHLDVFTIDHYPLTLRLINASGNQFQSIRITSRHREDSNLRQLILQSNQLEEFSLDTIVLPNSLEILSLANNRLKILDARLFSHLKNLKEIDVTNNQIKRVLPQLLQNINIKLDYNPLECQCTSNEYRVVCEKATTIRQIPVSETERNIFVYLHFIRNKAIIV